MLEMLFQSANPPGLEFRAAACLLFTGAAAYYDLTNRKWVPDWIAYAALACAAALNVLFFEPSVFAQAAALGAVVFGFTYALYRLGQLGGADVYIMSSIAASIPYFQQPFLSGQQLTPYPFIFSVLIPTGIAFMLHMLIRFIPYISRRISSGEVKINAKKLAEAALLFAALAAFSYALSTMPVILPPAYLAVLSFLSVSLLFFSLFKSEIKDSMVEMVPVGRLCAEDVLAIERMDPAIVKKHGISALMDKRVISAIKKARLKKVPVYTQMPFFLPYLFIGLLISLLFGDLFFLLL